MKRRIFLAVGAASLGLNVVYLTGCGGSSHSPLTTAPASIASFVANHATIADGNSATLTGVFANGKGVITPGNLAATSGTAVTVSPTATTTYTLTVTPPTGNAVTASAVIAVTSLPTITSFTASPTTITAGQSATLTGVFANGTAVITPGNLAATSGTAVTVSPSATTTYTLTVTPSSGTAVTATALITVSPNPANLITSFTANPATIAPGQSATLTGVFTKGAGVITPGNLAAISGAPVTVRPTTTTTYTLTVTPTNGTAVTATASVAVQSLVAVDLSSPGLPVTDQILGMNLAAWYDVTNSTNESAIQSGFHAAGIKAIRWPGGSWSDAYNWETNTECGSSASTDDDFTDVVKKLVIPAGLDLALTADYGTGKNCSGYGDPTEAAAWVAEATSLGITVSHMTVGNEEYGSWEVDHHSSPHNGATYAAAVAGTSGYYALIKAASPHTLVGVSVEPGYAPWDQDVMSAAPYDFVEYHYYPETPGEETDTYIVQQAAQELTRNINTIKSELAKWGTAVTPIYVGEIGGPYSNPGKQSWSITQGLYAGQVLGEMMNAGVSRLTWWIGFGNCNGQAGNDSSALYGWQAFGAYNVFSDGPADTTCPDAGAIGTLSPTARAFQLFSNVAIRGESVLTATVAGDTTDVRAYAATNPGGTALVLFNLNETTPQAVGVTLTGKTSSSNVSVTTYDKAIYDLSGSPSGAPADPSGTGTWAGPAINSLGAQSLPLTLTLTPWSMNVVIIQ
jgi:hypothetical protein